MKRNFGSLNLAALDLNSPFHTDADSAECSLADRFSAMDPSAEDCSMDFCGSEYSDDNVGFPLESLNLRDEAPQDMDLDREDVMSELTLPARSRPRSENGDVRVSRLLHQSAPEIPQHLHDQHHMELNALRCLRLKVMLSNLSTSNSNQSSNASVASNKPTYAYSGVNNRSKTALLPIRQPSLQSV